MSRALSRVGRSSSRAPRSFAVLAAWWLALVSLGCEARVSLGASCTYHSECGELLCLYGRCRAECLVDVDCGGGLVCNSGVCAERAEGCSESDPCEAPELACAGTLCATRCTATGGCSMGERCEMRVGGLVCIPTAAAPDDAGLEAGLALDASDVGSEAPDAAVAGTIRDVCLGVYHVCVARADGTVACWGVGHGGELGGGRGLVSGQPGTFDCAPLGALGSVCTLEPVVVVVDDTGTPLRDVTELRCGERTTLARTAGGTLYSWGLGSGGELGRVFPPIDNFDAIARPVTDRAAAPLVGVRGATLGSRHGCAWLEDGTTRCWGARYATPAGQLGTGASDPTFAEGAIVASELSRPSITIAVTDVGTCAGDALGVRCFGLNEAGVMGAIDSVETQVRTPLAVMGLPGPLSALVSGPQFVCAQIGAGAHCWGQAGEGALGRADVSDYATTRCPDGRTLCDPRAEPVAGALVFDAIASGTGSSTVCGVVAGRVQCWGASERGSAGLAPGGGVSRYEVPGPAVRLAEGGDLSNVRFVRLGGGSACAVTHDDRLYCWGANIAGQHRVTPDEAVHARAVLVPLD